MTMKRRLAAGGLAATLALTGIAATTAGVAWAVPTETTDSQSDTSRVNRILDALAGLVDDGTITSEQASAVSEHLASSDGMRGGPRGDGPRGGQRGDGLRGGGDETRMDGMRQGLELAAETLGLTVDELRTALREGDTLAQVAEEQGVAVEDLVDALVAAAEERLAEAVADGRITEERADEMAATISERIAERVEQTVEQRGPGGPHGRMGQPDDSA